MTIINSTLKIAKNSYVFWARKNWYYHRQLASFYQHIIPFGMRVLQVGSKTGNLLAALKPAYGIGIEWDTESFSYACKEYSQLRWYNSLAAIPAGEQFDYIILSSVLMEVYDIQDFLKQLKVYCHERTRIIIDTYSPWWEPILWLAQKCRLRRPTVFANGISREDISLFLKLSGYDVITVGRFLLLPYYIPVLSWIINSFVAQLPILNRFCLMEWVVARPVVAMNKKKSVSIIVPCKNERGNIERIVQESPSMGSFTEIIFVEGGSRDGTSEEIKRVSSLYPEKNVRFYQQMGRGKGDAMRLGFAQAKGDIVMILDGDVTVPAQELPKFFEALISGAGEFINGSRLVYGMEQEAMRFLNLLANHFFATAFSWLLGQRIKDTLCGTKVLYKKDYERIAANRLYFGDFDPFGDFDLLFGAAKLQLKIIDMPVHYKQRTYGTSQIHRFYHGFLLFKMMIFALKKFKFR
jgi:hypothetical protein